MQKELEVSRSGLSFDAINACKREVGHFLLVCSDCKVSDRQILGVDEASIFAHRNLGGLVQPTDISVMAALETSVNILEVANIVVCGHYDCLAVLAAFGGERTGITGNWLLDIERTAARYRPHLDSVESTANRLRALCELNTIEQAHRICSLGSVPNAWALGRPLTVRALMFDAVSGSSVDLGLSVSSANKTGDDLTRAIGRVWIDRIP
ncbi:MAG: hypothetical protein K1X36_15450 [Pyrinomonadaceae bacterium]|nr:hypothetical protein [Pyrinomonadaceae bacterium]